MTIVAISLSAILFILWVIVPLVPAVLIYRLFPNNPLVVSGPLAGLTVKTGGAFGAYLLIFVLTAWQIEKINSLIGGLRNQFLTVQTRLQFANEKGGIPFNSDEQMGKVEVVLKPQIHSLRTHEVTLRLVDDRDGLPQ